VEITMFNAGSIARRDVTLGRTTRHSLIALAACLLIGQVARAGAPTPNESDGAHISAPMQAAWQRYRNGVEEVRQMLYGHRFAENPAHQLEVHNLIHQIQAAAYTTVIAPRPDYPTIEAHTLFAPPVFNWIGPNPDFIYSSVFLDGRRTYRFWGRRSNTRMMLAQSSSAFYSDVVPIRLIGNHDMDQMKNPDGTFEITVSATKPKAGHWIQIDGNSRNNWLLMREAFYDWEREDPTEMHIEVADSLPRGPMLLGEEEFIHRMEGSVRFMKYCVNQIGVGLAENVLRKAGPNRFYSEPSGANMSEERKQMVANPAAIYHKVAFDLAPDEALIIEARVPAARYWSVMLVDWFDQTLDYVHRQSSINGHQARMDKGGVFRAVLSRQDPGVQNWLDPGERLQGIALFRWYFVVDQAELPTARKVPLSRLRDFLPTDTPTVTSEERARQLSARRQAALRRYFRY
jgi:hypothetical protein